jgi:hypothetical protein
MLGQASYASSLGTDHVITIQQPGGPQKNGHFGTELVGDNSLLLVNEYYLYNLTNGPTYLGHLPSSGCGQYAAVNGNLVAEAEACGGAHSYVLIYNVLTHSYVQNISSIHNYYSGSGFGYSLGLDNDLVIIGAPATVVNITECGQAYIFNITSGKLVQTLNTRNATSGGNFGFNVALVNGIAIVFAPFEQPVRGSSGIVYTFNATSGALLHTITNPNAKEGESLLTFALSVSGDYLAVGGYTPRGVQQSYVFNYATGSLEATLSVLHLPRTAEFGWLVGIGGNYVIVAAPQERVGGRPNGTGYGGAAYLFYISNGSLLKTLISPNLQYKGRFSSGGVVIAGSKQVVGAPDESSSGIEGAGNLYVFS